MRAEGLHPPEGAPLLGERGCRLRPRCRCLGQPSRCTARACTNRRPARTRPLPTHTPAPAGADTELEPGLPTSPPPVPVPEDWPQRAEAVLQELLAQDCGAPFAQPASQEQHPGCAPPPAARRPPPASRLPLWLCSARHTRPAPPARPVPAPRRWNACAQALKRAAPAFAGTRTEWRTPWTWARCWPTCAPASTARPWACCWTPSSSGAPRASTTATPPRPPPPRSWRAPRCCASGRRLGCRASRAAGCPQDWQIQLAPRRRRRPQRRRRRQRQRRRLRGRLPRARPAGRPPARGAWTAARRRPRPSPRRPRMAARRAARAGGSSRRWRRCGRCWRWSVLCPSPSRCRPGTRRTTTR
jgi:hypothetical protein